jgi:hypothetical protein
VLEAHYEEKRIESVNPGWPGEIHFLVADSSQVVKCFDRNVKVIEEHNTSQTFNSQMNVSFLLVVIGNFGTERLIMPANWYMSL